jgi:hypothetical protein
MRGGRIAAELTGEAMTESAILAAAFAAGDGLTTGDDVAAGAGVAA